MSWPILVINLKQHFVGNSAVDYCRNISKLAEKYGTEIAVCPSVADIDKIFFEVQNGIKNRQFLQIFSQKIDNVKPGESRTGSICADSITNACGTLLNHFECRAYDSRDGPDKLLAVAETARLALSKGLKVMLCADSVETAQRFAFHLEEYAATGSFAIALELDEFIGKKSIAKENPQEIKKAVLAVKKINSNIPVYAGAGIEADDIASVLELGCAGILAATAFTKAPKHNGNYPAAVEEVFNNIRNSKIYCEHNKGETMEIDEKIISGLLKTTEQAAIASLAWFGKKNKNSADQAAVDAMRKCFNEINFDGEIVIGEGEKDEAAFLYTGEKIGTGSGEKLDIAVDPLECTTYLSEGIKNSMSVLAAAPRGCLMKVPGTYMEKICVGPKVGSAVSLNKSVKENLSSIAKALGKEISEVNVCILNRQRHELLVKEVISCGARVRIIEHGDLAGAILPSIENSGIDVMLGTGGAPEGVIVAAALRCLGGYMEARISPHNEKFKAQAEQMGFRDFTKIFTINEIAKGNDCLFVATGITDGSLIKGIEKKEDKNLIYSLIINQKNKTLDYIKRIYLI